MWPAHFLLQGLRFRLEQAELTKAVGHRREHSACVPYKMNLSRSSALMRASSLCRT